MNYFWRFIFLLQAESVLSTLNNDKVDQSISEKLGLDDYETRPWDHVEEKTGAHRRQLTYTLNRQISQFGSKVSCIQQQEVSDDLRKLVIKEVLTYHDMPFADHFEVAFCFCIFAFDFGTVALKQMEIVSEKVLAMRFRQASILRHVQKLTLCFILDGFVPQRRYM